MLRYYLILDLFNVVVVFLVTLQDQIKGERTPVRAERTERIFLGFFSSDAPDAQIDMRDNMIL